MLELDVVPTSHVAAYVWRMWDGTTETTAEPSLTKKLNCGGDPRGTNHLLYDCTMVMDDGRTVLRTGTLIVNNAPIVLPTPTVSVNSRFFPYDTEIKLRALDLEGDVVSAEFFYDGTSIGHGTSESVGTVAAYWQGEYIGERPAYDFSLSTTVASHRIITAVLKDQHGGTAKFGFEFEGVESPALYPGRTASAGAVDLVMSLPVQKIGSVIMYSVYAKDDNGGDFTFSWSYAGSNGWAIGPRSDSGVSTLQPDGGYTNISARNTVDEPTGFKRAVCTVRNNRTLQETPVTLDMTFIANQVPVDGTIWVSVGGEAEQRKTGADLVPANPGDLIKLRVETADPDGDSVSYWWELSPPLEAGKNPPYVGDPPTAHFWGPVVYIPTDNWAQGADHYLQGGVTLIERLGGVLNLAMPKIYVRS